MLATHLETNIPHLQAGSAAHTILLLKVGGLGAFWILVAQMVKNLPAVQETPVQSLGWEDPLEKGKATQSSILTWRTPWTEEPGGRWSMGLQSRTQLSN